MVSLYAYNDFIVTHINFTENDSISLSTTTMGHRYETFQRNNTA
jgi:hypothetical protein